MTPTTLLIEALPRSVAAFQAMRDGLATTPAGGAAMFAIALHVFSEDEQAGIPLLTVAIDASQLVEGPLGAGGRQPRALRDFRERNGQKPWIARSMFQGTAPESGYALPPLPLRMELRAQPSDATPDDVKLFVVTTGAESPKPMRLKRNDKGLWKVLEWSSFQGNCRPPVVARVDEL